MPTAERARALILLTCACAALAALPRATHAQVYAVKLSAANPPSSDNCLLAVKLSSAQQSTGFPYYEQVWAHQPIYCTVNLDINWNELPYQARGRFRMWHASDPESTAELYSWHTAHIEPKQGTQQVKLQFVWSQAFSVGGVNGPGGPVTACQQRFQMYVTQMNRDPKELLIDGFDVLVSTSVMAEPEYIPGGKTQWVNSGKRAEGFVTMRLRCGGSRAVADQAFPPPRRQVAFRTTKAALTGYLGDSPTPLSGRTETSCPAQLRLVGTFDHVGNTPGQIRSRFRWTGGPTSTQMTTQVPRDSDHPNYTKPQVVLTVPIPLPNAVAAQPAPGPQGGFVAAQPARGPALAPNTPAVYDHKAAVRLEVTSTQGIISDAFEYHIVCVGGPGGPQGMAIPGPVPPPGGAPSGIAATPAQPPPPGGTVVQPPARARAAAGPSAAAAPDASRYARFTWVVEVPGHGVVGGFMQLDRAATVARGAQSITLARGLTDAGQLRRAIGASRTVVLVRREGGREGCRITLNGASVGDVRNERSPDQAQVTLTAQRVQDGCR